MQKLVTALVSVAFCMLATISFVNYANATPQQEKMKACNTEAKTKTLKGQERKAFMKSCLSTATTAAAEDKTSATAAAAEGKAPTPQQEKMKKCNADAKDKMLKGADRKAFMKDCLKS